MVERSLAAGAATRSRRRRPGAAASPEEQTTFEAAPTGQAPAAGDDLPELGVGPGNFPYGADSPTIWRGQIGDGSEFGPQILTYVRKHGNYLTPGGGIRALSLISVMIRAITLNLFVWLPILTAAMLGLLSVLWWLFPVGPVATGGVPPAGAAPDSPAAVGPPILSEGTLQVLLVDALITAGLISGMALVYFVLAALAEAADKRTNGQPTQLVGVIKWLIAPWGAWLVAIGAFLIWLLSWSDPHPRDHWQGLHLLLLAAGILAATFLGLCLVYSLATWLTRRLRRFGYRMRRLFEVWAAVYLTLIAVLAIIGATPDVAAWLTAPDDADRVVLVAGGAATIGDATAAGGPQARGMAQETSGVLALLAGLLGAGIAFVRSGSRVTESFRSMGFEVSGGVVASIAAALLLFGIVLITHAVAVQVDTAGQWTVFWAVVGVAVVVAWVVNSNHISLGRFYRDRLMEAFMPGYEAVQHMTTAPATAAADKMALHRASARAPYHIINTNVVLINAKNRRRRCIRGGDSFILTRDWCGSSATGWRATKEFMDDGMTLPTAVAISGAAANPNTGVGGVGLTRSRVVSVLMALLDLRLGYWVPHPLRRWQGAVPNHFRPGLFALLRGYHRGLPVPGALGRRPLREPRYLRADPAAGAPDPGLRRRPGPRLPIRGPADRAAPDRRGLRHQGALPAEPSHGGHHPAARRAHLSPRPRARTPRLCARPPLLPARPRSGRPHPARCRPRPPDLSQDHRGRPAAAGAARLQGQRNPDFPDQSTGDQFFDEDQFEAYRELGYRLGGAMITSLGLGALLQDLQHR